MERAFTVSPTLNSAADSIRAAIRAWGQLEEIKNGQLSTDHMIFALRDGVESAGHYRSLRDAEAFYGKVHQELKAAFENGTLAKRGILLSPLVKPIQFKDVSEAFALMPKAVRGISNFQGVSAEATPSIGSEINVKEFGLMAGGDFFTSRGWLIGVGWAFARDDKISLTAGLYDKQGAFITALPFQAGEDVYRYMSDRGMDYANAKTSRFSFKVEGYDLKSGVTIRFLDSQGRIFREIPMDGNIGCKEDSAFHYCFDDMKSETQEKFFGRFVARANKVTALYQAFVPILSLLAGAAYLVISLQTLQDVRKKQALRSLPGWLVLTGVGGTFILFVMSMCIITATSFDALVYWYTAPAYILLLMFCVVSLGSIIETFLLNQKRNG